MSEVQFQILSTLVFLWVFFWLSFLILARTFSVDRSKDDDQAKPKPSKLASARKAAWTLASTTCKALQRGLQRSEKEPQEEQRKPELPPAIEYPVAKRHRPFRIGRRTRARLFVSDWPNQTSTGKLAYPSGRVLLSHTVTTGPLGDGALLAEATAFLKQTP